MPEYVETVIVGGGQAGLAMSYHLAQRGREHVILERGRVAERWRSERWDSLAFQFPSAQMSLPGYAYAGADPDGFMPREGVVAFIEDYARRIAPPIRCGVRVTAVREQPATGRLLVETDNFSLQAKNVVAATGPFQLPRIPDFSAALPPNVTQVTANRYANPDQLPPGAVLVVGSGGSGVQIAEELLGSGRTVYLAVGRHRCVPRRYRGKDYGWWLEATGFLMQTVETMPADWIRPLLTGANGGHDVNLRSLAQEGMVLAGRLQAIDGSRLSFEPGLEANLAKADEEFDLFTKSVDLYILDQGLDAPEAPREHPVARGPRPTAPPLRELDLRTAGIASVIWATGYRYDFGWLKCPVLNPAGIPVHRRGVSAVPGVYFLGLVSLYRLKSGFLYGVGEDAAYLAEHIAQRA